MAKLSGCANYRAKIKKKLQFNHKVLKMNKVVNSNATKPFRYPKIVSFKEVAIHLLTVVSFERVKIDIRGYGMTIETKSCFN